MPTLTPLSLVVLELLQESPKHPYEIQRLVHERGLTEVINFKPASLYSTVKLLAGRGLIEPVETSREGKRPERTVYRISEAGVDQLLDGLRSLLEDPRHEFPAYAAGLALILVFARDEALRLLRRRCLRLEAEVAAGGTILAGIRKSGLPRILAIESEYLHAMREAELTQTRLIIDDIESGAITWPDANILKTGGTLWQPHS